MPPTSAMTEREKFTALLRLASEQIQALEAGNLAVFDKIVADKRAIVESLEDASKLVAGDPLLQGVVEQIRLSDQKAQQLLLHKIGAIGRRIREVRQSRTARNAYRRVDKRPNILGFKVDENTPRYFDQRM